MSDPIPMKLLTDLRTLFGWTESPASEFLRLKSTVGVLPLLPADSANAAMLTRVLPKDLPQVTSDAIYNACAYDFGGITGDSLFHPLPIP